MGYEHTTETDFLGYPDPFIYRFSAMARIAEQEFSECKSPLIYLRFIDNIYISYTTGA